MESVKFLKEIKWEKVLGGKPRIKNLKEIKFFGELEKQTSLTRIIKLKILDQEYIMNHYDSCEIEQIEIKNNRSVLLLKLNYNKKTEKLVKKVNYDFCEIVIYFLESFFEKRLKNDKEFNTIREYLKKYEEISLEISECAL